MITNSFWSLKVGAEERTQRVNHLLCRPDYLSLDSPETMKKLEAIVEVSIIRKCPCQEVGGRRWMNHRDSDTVTVDTGGCSELYGRNE